MEKWAVENDLAGWSQRTEGERLEDQGKVSVSKRHVEIPKGVVTSCDYLCDTY